MIYHVQIDGKDAGAFSLEDLRRRRLAGLMTGHELVWCAGMPSWQTLDAVLGVPAGFVPEKKKDPWMVAGIVAGTIAILCCIGLYIYLGRSIVKKIQTASRGISRTTSSYSSTGGTQGVEAARKPIDQTTNSLTESDVRQRRKAFRVRQYLEAYQKQGSHGKPWDGDAKIFIRSWIDSNFGGNNGTNAVNITALGDKLAADTSCDDPIVLLIAADSSVEYFESRDRYERAMAAFTNSRYKAYPRLFAAVELAFKRSERAGPLDQSALQFFKESLSDGSVRAEDQPDLFESMANDWGSGFFARKGREVCEVAEQAGTSFHWLALMLRGVDEINLAWKARGGGWANTVTAAGAQGFQDHMDKARTVLSEAWKLHPEWPQAATKMITVAMAGSDVDETRQWFDRVTAAQLDYPEAWRNMRWALRPRWLGSREALKDLGIAALDSGRFDTDLPRQFFDCVSDIEADSDDLRVDQHLYGHADIWPKMQRMYEGYIAERAQTNSVDGWRRSYAVVAYYGQHYDVSREQLEKVGWRIPPRKLEGWGSDASLLPLEVAARTSWHRNEIDRAEQARDDDRIEEALQVYQKLSQGTNDERTQQFIQHRVASLEMERRLQSGDWVDFLPKSTNDLNWLLKRGLCTVLPNDVVEIKSGPEGSMFFSRVRVGNEFEIKGECEVVSSTTKDFQAGIVMGLPELDYENWFSFRIKRNANEGEVASYSKGWTLSGTPKPVKINDRRNSFDISFHGGKADASVNGKMVMVNAKYPGTARVTDNQTLAGLGAYNDMNETVIRYSHVQVRRLGLGVSFTRH